MQTKFLGALFAAALLAGPALAQDKTNPNDRVTFTANVTGVSDYSFRGVSQTDNNPAIQGSFESAFMINESLTGYFSLWGSNVHFVPEVANGGAAAEADFTAGLRGTVDSFGWDVKFIYYAYPGATSSLNYDYQEVAAAVNYDFGFVIPTIGLNYSPNFYGNTGKATYLYGGVKVPIPFTEFSPRVLANVGRQNVKDNATFTIPDYTDWNVGFFVTFFGALDVGVQYVDTNVKTRQCVAASLDDLCKGRVIGSVGYTLTF
jgi:uncharacterized protein (TIGR02001 family)